MSRTIDLAGQVFGMLTVIERAPADGGQAKWVCRCACGETVVKVSQSLREGRAVACGPRKLHETCDALGCNAIGHTWGGSCPRHWSCDIDGCDRRDRHARGLCHRHYAAMRYAPRERKRTVIPACTVRDCQRRQHARRLCGGHYLAWLRVAYPRTCQRPGCARMDVMARGLCQTHYRWDRMRNRAPVLSEGVGQFDHLTHQILGMYLRDWSDHFHFKAQNQRAGQRAGLRYAWTDPR